MSGGSGTGFNPMDVSNLMMVKKQQEEIDSRIDLNEALGYKARTEGNAIGEKLPGEIGVLDAKQKKMSAEVKGILQNVDESLQRTRNLKQQKDLTDEQWSGLIEQEIQKGWVEMNRAENIKADTSLKKRQQREIGERLDLMTTDLLIKNEANRIKNTQVEVDRLKAEITKYIGELQVDQKTKQMWMDNAVRLIGVIASFMKPGGGGLEIINNVVQ